jgi:hypothetical protein
MLYAFFWVITRHLNFIFQRFGTLFHLHTPVGILTLAYKIRTPGNHPEESTQQYLPLLFRSSSHVRRIQNGPITCTDYVCGTTVEVQGS